MNKPITRDILVADLQKELNSTYNSGRNIITKLNTLLPSSYTDDLTFLTSVCNNIALKYNAKHFNFSFPPLDNTGIFNVTDTTSESFPWIAAHILANMLTPFSDLIDRVDNVTPSTGTDNGICVNIYLLPGLISNLGSGCIGAYYNKGTYTKTNLVRLAFHINNFTDVGSVWLDSFYPIFESDAQYDRKVDGAIPPKVICSVINAWSFASNRVTPPPPSFTVEKPKAVTQKQPLMFVFKKRETTPIETPPESTDQIFKKPEASPVETADSKNEEEADPTPK